MRIGNACESRCDAVRRSQRNEQKKKKILFFGQPKSREKRRRCRIVTESTFSFFFQHRFKHESKRELRVFSMNSPHHLSHVFIFMLQCVYVCSRNQRTTDACSFTTTITQISGHFFCVCRLNTWFQFGLNSVQQRKKKRNELQTIFLLFQFWPLKRTRFASSNFNDEVIISFEIHVCSRWFFHSVAVRIDRKTFVTKTETREANRYLRLFGQFTEASI